MPLIEPNRIYGVLRRSTERKETAPLPAASSFTGNLIATMRGLLSSFVERNPLIVARQTRAELPGLQSRTPRVAA